MGSQMIRTKMMSHQQLIVDYSIDKNYAGIFADFGTGKTLAFLGIVEKLGLRRVLVVSTKLSIQSTWPDEIRMHSNFKWIILLGQRKRKLQLLRYGLKLAHTRSGYYYSGTDKTIIFLLNYDGVRNIFHEIMGVRWDVVCLDESTKIKSPHTLRTRTMWELGKSIERRYIMTGFPVTENLADIYSQIKFLRNDDFLGKSYYAFLATYFVKMGMKILPKKKMIGEVLDKISGFCIRITNETLNLPPKMYKKIGIEKTEQQEKLLEEFKSSFRLEFGKVKLDTQYIFALMTKSLQICDGFIQDNEGHIEAIETNKDETLIEMLDEIDIRKNKVVIWCAFRFSVAKIQNLLTKLKVPTLILTGDVEGVNTVIRTFQGSTKYNVLIATQKKAAESITLTACRCAIYYSNIWSYDSRQNSEARIRRKGSEKHDSIMYIDFVTNKSVEGQVYECLRKKKNLIEEMKEHFLAIQ